MTLFCLRIIGQPSRGSVSDLAAHTDAIRDSLTTNPVWIVAEACERIEKLAGLTRRPSQVRVFLKGLGFKWRRTRAIPIPPKKTDQSTSGIKKHSWTLN